MIYTIYLNNSFFCTGEDLFEEKVGFTSKILALYFLRELKDSFLSNNEQVFFSNLLADVNF